MRYWIILSFCLPLFGLDLSIQVGKEKGETFSVLHLRHSTPFTCQPTIDEFGEIRRVDCRFSTPPKQSFSPIDNEQLKISAAASSKGYVISVVPKGKMRLMPINFDLTKEAQTYQNEVKSAAHWSVVGYKNTFPLIDNAKPSDTAINFPIKVAKNTPPYVGGLDLKGNPIKIRRVQDVTDYMEMKKAYVAKQYDKVLEKANDTLKEYPNTVFKNELMLYQIRAYHKMGDFEKLIAASKKFMREYSGDSNVAEVLTYTANAYSKMGQITDADYYFDRLFDEQGDSPFAAQGMIYKAEQSETTGDPKKAKNFYERALASTSDVSIASQAAFNLAKLELTTFGDLKKASKYIDKIATVNPGYFNEERSEAMTMANTFVDRNDPKTAARITEALLNATDKKLDDYQLLLRNLGVQLAKAGKRNEALKRFNEYLDQFKYGEYAEEVRHAKDGLFFDDGDRNTTKSIKKYDDLIERYGNDTVGKKALYKKAQLLLEEKKYKEILNLESDLYRLDTADYPETNAMIAKSAIGLTKEYLKDQKCVEAMKLQKMYKVKLLLEWDESLFNCALKTTQFPVAKAIAQRHLKAPSVAERELWLYRLAKTQFELGEYKDTLKGGNELVTLLGVEKNPPLNDIYRILFDTAQRISDNDGMIRYIKAIEAVYPNDFKDIERYNQMVSLGLKRKDEAMTQTYGRKVVALQERTKSYTQSPFIEFTLAQSYQNLGKDADALNILKTLNKQKLTNDKRSRQQYLIGAIEQRLGHKREARDAFNASIKADPNSAWGKLAKDALALF